MDAPRTRALHRLSLCCVAATLLLLLAACGGPPAPASPPEVSSSSPSDGASGVSQAADVVVTFSETMNESSAEAAFDASPSISCNFSWNTSSTELTCDPQTNLDPGTSYTVTVGSSAESAEGISLESDHQFSFTTAGTAGAPSVVSTSPDDGDSAVGTNVNIVVRFSEEMDRPSTESAFTTTPAMTCTFTWNAASTRLTCNPDSGLNSNETYTVTIGDSAQAAGGDALGSDYAFTFTTTDTSLEACRFGSSTLGNCVLN